MTGADHVDMNGGAIGKSLSYRHTDRATVSVSKILVYTLCQSVEL